MKNKKGRYLLFIFDHMESFGGLNDLVCYFNKPEEILEIEDIEDKCGYSIQNIQVFDLETLKLDEYKFELGAADGYEVENKAVYERVKELEMFKEEVS